jgi:hypothetical protein
MCLGLVATRVWRLMIPHRFVYAGLGWLSHHPEGTWVHVHVLLRDADNVDSRSITGLTNRSTAPYIIVRILLRRSPAFHFPSTVL